MSSELLRIHDENNNCDLVAVANPMGNFHMSTYAEMQDGTLKPVDGWYLFSKMIEKLGQGGGEQPESGVTVVAFELDSHENVTGSLTPEQVKTAMLTTIVIGTESVEGADPEPIGPAFYDPVEDSVSFGLYYGSAGLQGLIISNEFGWNAG